MKFIRITILMFLALNAGNTIASTLFLETFTPEDASYSSTGWILRDESFIGIRFSTSEVTHLSGIVGTFSGSGTFFSAITSLSGPRDFPTATLGFSPSDMLVYSERAVVAGPVRASEDHLFEINVTLDPGNYFVFFGGVDSTVGFMPWAPDLSKSNIPLFNYLEYALPQDPSVNGWFEFEPSGVRIALLESPVPPPIAALVDIKFCKDPNAFNCKSSGVLPLTIFGTDALDVAEIDPNTLRLCREDLSECTNGPRNWSIADRGDPDSDLGASMCSINPIDGEEFDFLNPDGLFDLDAAFEVNEIRSVLGDFCGMPKNSVSGALVIIGLTFEGKPIQTIPVNNTGIDQLVKKNH